MKYIFVLFIFLLSINCGFASNSKKMDAMKPQWLDKHLPKPSNKSFRYVVTESLASELEQARNKCMMQVIQEIERTFEVGYEGKSEGKSVETGSATIAETIHKEYSYKYNIKSDVQEVKFRKIDEYWEVEGNQNYRCYVLYAVSEKPNLAKFDDISFTYKPSASSVALSALYPGLGQLHKGQKAKGWMFLTGETAIIAGALYCESERKDYLKKTKQVLSVEKIRFYEKKANDYREIRNICIISAILVYGCSLADAAFHNGRKRPVIHQNITLAPTINPEYSGVHLAFKF